MQTNCGLNTYYTTRNYKEMVCQIDVPSYSPCFQFYRNQSTGQYLVAVSDTIKLQNDLPLKLVSYMCLFELLPT